MIRAQLFGRVHTNLVMEERDMLRGNPVNNPTLNVISPWPGSWLRTLSFSRRDKGVSIACKGINQRSSLAVGSVWKEIPIVQPPLKRSVCVARKVHWQVGSWKSVHVFDKIPLHIQCVETRCYYQTQKHAHGPLEAHPLPRRPSCPLPRRCQSHSRYPFSQGGLC